MTEPDALDPAARPTAGPAGERIRVVIAKPGLDGHDRGAKVVASALRDAGMEVIYTGLHQTPEMIVEAAIQEDADVVALSILSGAHMTIFPRVLELLRAEGAERILVTGGGIISREDMAELERLGTGRLFGPGTSTRDIVDYIRGWKREGLEAAGASRGSPPPQRGSAPAGG
ncbi:MAG: cobalamin B12-binding domain-containing protein [Gemmatimonadetes bacterium]|nr:cobalamin B12-binding domain-containing protein [Gemmatimonadota bacterium]